MPNEQNPAGRAALHRSNLEMNRLTKEALSGALLLLMREKDYASISITELAARAGVSRNGFYRNYTSKDDIVKDTIFSFNQKLYESIGKAFAVENPRQWYHHFFLVVRKYADTLKPLMAAGFRGTYLQITDEYILSTYPPRNTEERYLMLAWNGAIQNITFDWIDNGMVTPEEQMSELCSRLLPQMAG